MWLNLPALSGQCWKIYIFEDIEKSYPVVWKRTMVIIVFPKKCVLKS